MRDPSKDHPKTAEERRQFETLNKKPEHQPIRDACPVCEHVYEWDACLDCYRDTTESESENSDATITVFRCSQLVDGSTKLCRGIVAVSITDLRYGSQVYIPSMKEL